MALRAGYYGVKKNVLNAISKLSGAKVIKSIGDGLKLTTAGKLSCDIDTDTMEFKNGKLSAKGGGSVIDTTNVIKATTQYSGSGEYEATGPCAVIVKYAAVANSDAYISINDVKVADLYVQNGISSNVGMFILGAGDVISFVSTYTQDPQQYTVYGLK